MSNHTYPAPDGGNAIRTIDEIVRRYHQPTAFNLSAYDKQSGDVELLAVPEGIELKDLKSFRDARRDRPERRKGTAHFVELASFIAHVNRFKDDDSAVFVDPTPASPRVTAVIDYHRQGHESAPRFGEHRSIYTPELSDEWKAWTNHNGKKLDQQEFAEFLEDRIGDVRQPELLAAGQPHAETDAQRMTREIGELLQGSYAGPQKLMELAAGLKVTVVEHTAQAVTLSSGEATLLFNSEHKDGEGKKLTVPSLFHIAVPVWKGGEPYLITVRLRYRVMRSQVSWFYQLYRTDKVLDHVIAGAAARIGEATGLPVYLGKPEA